MTKPIRAEKREQKKRKKRRMKVSGASVKKLRKIQLDRHPERSPAHAGRSRGI